MDIEIISTDFRIDEDFARAKITISDKYEWGTVSDEYGGLRDDPSNRSQYTETHSFETLITGSGGAFSFHKGLTSDEDMNYDWNGILRYVDFRISISVLSDTTIRVSELTERLQTVDRYGTYHPRFSARFRMER